MFVPSIIDAKYNPAKMQNPLAIPRFVESSTPKITHSILRRPYLHLRAGFDRLIRFSLALTFIPLLYVPRVHELSTIKAANTVSTARR